MPSPRLPNYLRSFRKRFGLSQDDVAFLLGTESGAKICRYERFTREPNLKTILALEALFNRPSQELFAGLFQSIEYRVCLRAKQLAEQSTGRKREKLQALAKKRI